MIESFMRASRGAYKLLTHVWHSRTADISHAHPHALVNTIGIVTVKFSFISLVSKIPPYARASRSHLAPYNT